MTVESDVADVYALILSKKASEETARTAAMALCRELMPGSDERVVRQTVARAIATVRSNQQGGKK
jgi:hypothetical protein